MQRIPPVDPATLEGEIAEAYRNSPSGDNNFFRLQAQAPTAFWALRPFFRAIFAELQLDPFDRELVVLLVAALEGGAYEWMQHEVIGASMGITRAQMDALKAGQLTSPLFTPKQQALLAFAKQAVEDVRVDDPTFAAAHAHYGHRELVETLYTIGCYMMLARISEVARLELDAPTGINSLRAAEAEVKARREAEAEARAAAG
ncbi:MAG: carboxymuconolactone decarboxylase family protein [Caulobacteraceae bacterium]|nr:carboxymuconolactone decarboxylase family protein [Caulobacteraceae bacterium]